MPSLCGGATKRIEFSFVTPGQRQYRMLRGRADFTHRQTLWQRPSPAQEILTTQTGSSPRYQFQRNAYERGQEISGWSGSVPATLSQSRAMPSADGSRAVNRPGCERYSFPIDQRYSADQMTWCSSRDNGFFQCSCGACGHSERKPGSARSSETLPRSGTRRTE